MSIQNKIDQYSKDIRELGNTLHEVQGKEILPLSFFSSSIDTLNRLRTGIYEIESIQLQMMQEHLEQNENDWSEENKPVIPVEPVVMNPIEETPIEDKSINEIPIPATNILANTIVRKINTDFLKSLSLNDRFMFQRDLFQGNANEMNQAFAQLNAFQTLDEVLAFLNEKYAITWNSDSGIVLKELLDKRFA